MLKCNVSVVRVTAGGSGGRAIGAVPAPSRVGGTRERKPARARASARAHARQRRRGKRRLCLVHRGGSGDAFGVALPPLTSVAFHAAALLRIERALQFARRYPYRADRPQARHRLEFITHLLDCVSRLGRHGLIDEYDVGLRLLMDSRLGDRLLGIEMKVEDVERHLDHARNYRGTARAAQHQDRSPAQHHDGWRHTRKRTLARRDLVGLCPDKFVRVGDARRDGKVVHLVVKDEPERRNHHFGAKYRVDRRRDGYHVPVLVHDAKVRRAMVIRGSNGGWRLVMECAVTRGERIPDASLRSAVPGMAANQRRARPADSTTTSRGSRAPRRPTTAAASYRSEERRV